MNTPTDDDQPVPSPWRGLFSGRLPLHKLGRQLQESLLHSDSFVLTTLAVGIGVLTGFGASLFHLALEETDSLLRQAVHVVGLVDGGWIIVFFPIIGALSALGLIWLFARDDHSHGTSAVIESVAFRGGRLPGRALLTKVAAAALFIGSGGSAGPEDPSVQLGGIAGSKVGQLFRLSEQRLKTLVASGVAGAVAAAFNAPIAGVFFAFEVVVGELSAALFPPVVLASVAAAAISHWLHGNHPAFDVPTYGVGSALTELPLYAILGVLSAIVGVLFIRLVFRIEGFFEKRNPSRVMRGLTIGLAAGLIGMYLPEVLGVGYETVGDVLLGKINGASDISLLLGAKLLLTSLCIAGIGVGGTFAPSLYLGAMLGMLMGLVVQTFVPGTTAAAFALVGMGGVLTAVVRTPITAVLLLFEITNDYRIILPIMLCVAVSNLIAGKLFKESIYTERLARRGIRLRSGKDMNIMESMRVEEAMTRRFDSVTSRTSLRSALDLMTDRHHHAVALVDSGRLVGLVTTTDVGRALENGADPTSPVSQIATTDLLVAFPDQSLHEVVPLFAVRDIKQVPVVDRLNPRRLVGMLRQSDFVRSYHAGVIRRTEMEQQDRHVKIRPEHGLEVFEITLDRDSPLIGQTVLHLPLPPDCLLTTIHFGHHARLPKDNTILQPGMRLTFLTTPEAIETLRSFNSDLPAERVNITTSPRYHEVIIGADAPAIGMAVRELNLPEGVLLVAIDRKGQRLVPKGKTVVEEDDVMTLFADPHQLPKALLTITGSSAVVMTESEMGG